MSTDVNAKHVARCRCGAVEVEARAEPLVVAACYCDDCQAAGRQIADLFEDGTPPTTTDGGTEFMVFQRDRIACARGAQHLQATRLTEGSKTRRMIAGCCGAPMYMAFDDRRPWVSAFRSAFGAGAPPVEMRICTRFRRATEPLDDRIPSHAGYPPAMMLRILGAALAMLFRRPVGALP